MTSTPVVHDPVLDLIACIREDGLRSLVSLA